MRLRRAGVGVIVLIAAATFYSTAAIAQAPAVAMIIVDPAAFHDLGDPRHPTRLAIAHDLPARRFIACEWRFSNCTTFSTTGGDRAAELQTWIDDQARRNPAGQSSHVLLYRLGDMVNRGYVVLGDLISRLGR